MLNLAWFEYSRMHIYIPKVVGAKSRNFCSLLWLLATCDAICWVSGMIFCNNFARWLQKIVATCVAICWFSWDAMIFCNNFARWLQKIVAVSPDLQRMREYSNLGLGSTFLLNHFMATHISQKWFKWNVLLNPRFEYSRILCKSGLTEINFRSKPMLSHVAAF